MPRTLIDVTLPISDKLPVWPGDPPVYVTRVSDDLLPDEGRRTKDEAVHVTRGSDDLPLVSGLSMSCHAGTHVDAPAHFLLGGAGVDILPLDVLIGPAWVVRFAGRGPLTASMLAGAAIPPGTVRLLIRSDNSDGVVEAFDPDFVALAPDAAAWLLDHGVRLVGIDGPSIEAFDAPGDPVHRALLAAGVIIVENLALAGVASGAYELTCLPLRIAGCDGAPARVVLVTRDE
jgi:arylformamidase